MNLTSPHRPLRTRFRAAIATAFLGLLPEQGEQFFVPKSSLGETHPLFEHVVLGPIARGLYLHQDLPVLSEIFSKPEQWLAAYAIALSCRDALHPRSLIAEFSRMLPSDSTLIPQLHITRQLVERGAGSTVARTQLEETSLAYGLYCFLSTPDMPAIARQRSGQLGSPLRMTVGAIAAAYTGVMPEANDRAEHEPIDRGLALGDRLFAAWAGISNPDSFTEHAADWPAVTAPDILGRRA